jgi:YHS domain-containing protein
MKKFVAAAVILSVALVAGSSTNFAQEKQAEPKCPVSGKAIDKDASVEFNGGKVYFCCMNCPKAFAKTPEKFAAKANHQLTVTGQAKEIKCPFTGKELNPETKIDVQGAPVCFCCNNCKGKAEAADAQKQIEMIFNDKSFKKGFEVKPGGN